MTSNASKIEIKHCTWRTSGPPNLWTLTALMLGTLIPTAWKQTLKETDLVKKKTLCQTIEVRIGYRSSAVSLVLREAPSLELVYTFVTGWLSTFWAGWPFAAKSKYRSTDEATHHVTGRWLDWIACLVMEKKYYSQWKMAFFTWSTNCGTEYIAWGGWFMAGFIIVCKVIEESCLVEYALQGRLGCKHRQKQNL